MFEPFVLRFEARNFRYGSPELIERLKANGNLKLHKAEFIT
jgi:hypothetical protein